MAYIDPELMGVFRRKIRNPAHMWNAYHIMRSYRGADLATPAGAFGAVDRLSFAMGVPITAAQRDGAARWLMQCGVDPHNREHRRAMWNWLHF